jgi:hypothetical protein
MSSKRSKKVYINKWKYGWTAFVWQQVAQPPVPGLRQRMLWKDLSLSVWSVHIMRNMSHSYYVYWTTSQSALLKIIERNDSDRQYQQKCDSCPREEKQLQLCLFIGAGCSEKYSTCSQRFLLHTNETWWPCSNHIWSVLFIYLNKNEDN